MTAGWLDAPLTLRDLAEELACLILSAFCLNIYSRPFEQILWILFIYLFVYHSLFRLSELILLLTRPFNQNTWSSFFYFVFCCERPFD